MARKYDYEGLSLTNLRKVKGGLKKDILQAKLEAAYLLHEAQEFKDEHGSVIEPEVTKFYEIEAELVRDAIVNFLTSDKLNWTIAEMKASLEIEEISTVAPLKEETNGPLQCCPEFVLNFLHFSSPTSSQSNLSGATCLPWHQKRFLENSRDVKRIFICLELKLP